MVRTVLIELALFLSPFVLYGALLLATKGSVVPAHWSPRVLGVLGLIALILMAGGLVVFESGRGAPAGTRYIPAEMRDGVFVPGRYE